MNQWDMNNDIERVLYSEADIAEAAERVGKQLAVDYEGRTPIILSVLKGAVLWTVDVMRHMQYAEVEFIDVSSYNGGVASSGEVQMVTDLQTDISGRDIIIMEDIVDTGRSLKFMIDLLMERGAKSVKVASLLDKKEGRVVEATVDYIGFDVPKAFVVGYGLDYKQLYRNLPYVGVLKREVYDPAHADKVDTIDITPEH
ncbi:hypoxanthine phosphoribosyltransferase [Weissella confusa]|uniref:hypoxanthine phosphoribosyltransferase n=1 Tax=Weissella confusa TaxID=1583 RepID=UPI0021AF8825|nr:hypoxanthine phosphoribosyltransferase [Weissella confusa]MCS9989304.1 hypoxanthine phosphoribosyltransferase [Weissella confusa]MCS9991447.1 hypoxanthine phosphoribosyltransferase [Weissella confusa]MCS9991495.1 hypoxanthine phosphoribosyltransferase [Weissella confusa]